MFKMPKNDHLELNNSGDKKEELTAIALDVTYRMTMLIQNKS